MYCEQLIMKLEELRVDPRSYCIGTWAEESYCLEHYKTVDTWLVYYHEHGHKSGLMTFASESKACKYFLQLILNDSSTRLD